MTDASFTNPLPMTCAQTFAPFRHCFWCSLTCQFAARIEGARWVQQQARPGLTGIAKTSLVAFRPGRKSEEGCGRDPEDGFDSTGARRWAFENASIAWQGGQMVADLRCPPE